MKTVEEHLGTVLSGVRELPPFQQQLMDAHGSALCEDVVAGFDLPLFDNSAMDGYAVRFEDVASATETNPVVLPVVGDVPAGGTETHALAPGLALRIMTGAPIPHGADTVIPVEWTDGGVAKVAINHAPGDNRFIRRRGEDVVAGQLLVRAGTHLDAKQLAVLASVGRDEVWVRPRPRVVVLSTGSELREPGEQLGEGTIYDANSFALAAAAREAGAIAYRVGVVPDDEREFIRVLEDQLVRADVVVTSGGVSVGAYDIVKQVLSRLGTVEFTQVAMQPGMPQGFGVVGEDSTPIFTLPGNPVSAYVSFQVFVLPAIRKMLGVTPYILPTVMATATSGWRSSVGRRQYARVEYAVGEDGRARVTPVSGPGSHLVAGLARANALAVIPEGVHEVPEGATLEVMVLDS
ncbi:gephyrin-like molybdotransferase Glp [Actinopolymorpha alba]|uniref:molybdotransferase-like divisome protein Glp n=1 Tax=Actinopolymorpha alba TaxID=533267 RepID=UPI0003717B34|nr:gephyrin-like molybdotransferase Glp [Actinopolymorpha alba]